MGTRLSATTAAGLALAVASTTGAATAASTATGTVIADPAANVHASANTSSKVVKVLDKGTKVTIDCTTTGPAVAGVYETTKIWDHITSPVKGYLTDAFLETGTNGAAVSKKCGSTATKAPTSKPTSTSTPKASPTPKATAKPKPVPKSLSKKVDAFVKKYAGKPVDYDGQWGAQCVDLFEQYNREVIGATFASGDYAYQIWTSATYDHRKYTKIPAKKTPKKGDVAIWSKAYPYGGGGGHIAIVTSTKGSSFYAFSQNPNAPKTLKFSHKYVLGFLRPKVK